MSKAALNDNGVGHLFVWCSNNFAAAVATQAILYQQMTGDNRYVAMMQEDKRLTIDSHFDFI